MVFAPGVVSTPETHEFGSVFSSDGRSFFLGVDLGGRSEIRSAQVVNGRWTEFETVISHPTYSYNDPFLSPDEDRLYFISDQPFDGEGVKKDHDIWYAERRDGGWSAPRNAGQVINSAAQDYYISFTETGTMYFSSNVGSEEGRDHDFDLYASEWRDGEFTTALRLPDTVNSRAYEADVFVAPDASYLIFVSARREGRGRGDLYVSFRDAEGEWTEVRSLGSSVNTAGHELCPFVSADGEHLFFTRDGDIYWVDASIIEPLRDPPVQVDDTPIQEKGGS